MRKELERVRVEIVRAFYERECDGHDCGNLMPKLEWDEYWTGFTDQEKIEELKQADPILSISGLVVLSDNQELPEVEEDNPFIRLDEQQKMLKSNFRRVIE